MSAIRDAAYRLAEQLPRFAHRAANATSGDEEYRARRALAEALAAFGEACAGRVEPGPCEAEARALARKVHDERAALRTHAIPPELLKPFPVPGSTWEWLGNDVAKPMAPSLVTGLRWFRGRAEAMFGEGSAAGVEHMMNLREWRCVGEPAPVDILTAAELDAVIVWAEHWAKCGAMSPAGQAALAKLRAARGTR